MKIKELLVSTAVILALSTSIAFAAPENTGISNSVGTELQDKDCHRHKHDAETKKDPIKDLEEKKNEVKSLLKEGKITKEKADEILGSIDNRIEEIKEFNKLTLDQKKEKITKDFKAHLDQMVKDGKMAKDEADKMMKEITEKLKDWDGTNYPKYHERKHRQ